MAIYEVNKMASPFVQFARKDDKTICKIDQQFCRNIYQIIPTT